MADRWQRSSSLSTEERTIRFHREGRRSQGRAGAAKHGGRGEQGGNEETSLKLKKKKNGDHKTESKRHKCAN